MKSGDEHNEQVELFEWVDDCINLGIHKELIAMFAIPNESYGGTRRDIIRGRRLKAEGRKRGVPDIFLAVPKGKYHGLFIEMKTTKGVLSRFQKEWIKTLNNNGFLAIVCRSSNEAIEKIEKYLNLNT